MEQSDFDSITARVRHLRENIAELQKNYDQLILNVKLKSGSPSVTQKEGVQQAEPQQVFQVPELRNANSAYTSPSSMEKYKFRALASIRTVAPGFREISELPYWVFNVVHESWHNNPHLKRGEELEIKFITTTSEDITNSIQYPSFHFMKLQMPDQRAFTYIKAQETKPALVVNLTEDEVSTRRA
ncbi:hypothetical protein ACS0TY_034047 [Phlomoides rotata]